MKNVEYDCKEWGIQEKLNGNVVQTPADIYFTVDKKDTGAFIDLIYFFLMERGHDSMLGERYRVSW